MWRIPVYAVVGSAVWLAVLESGIHATVAAVVLGLLTPVQLPSAPNHSVAERLESALHPWTSFLLIPLFAFANAGLRIDSAMLADSVESLVALGIVLGLRGSSRP